MKTDFNIAKIDIFDEHDNLVASATQMSVEGDRMMLHGDNLPILPIRSAVKAVGYSSDGVFIMSGTVSLSVESQMNLDFCHIHTRDDRREFFKVRTDDQATVHFAIFQSMRYGFLYEDRIRLRDISLGGLCFYSNKTYFTDQLLTVELDGVRSGFMVRIKLLRKKRERNRAGYRYRYAGRLLDLDVMQQRILLEHIFKVELTQHQSEVDLWQ